ncbi:MAG: hypothetical protein K2O16_14235 [Lachnospiraceae bacterium]|nr:hypothetical protein [Lachnospiraceae bacterium]MDE7333359.1 hypothetical protein [Lachnospiraceae bacterium]
MTKQPTGTIAITIAKRPLQTVPLSPYPIAAINIHGTKEITPAAIDTAAKTTHNILLRLGDTCGFLTFALCVPLFLVMVLF